MLLLMTAAPHTTSAQLAKSVKPFDCSWQYTNCGHCLQVKWTQSKLDYCCKNEQIGCKTGAVTPATTLKPVGFATATDAPSASLPSTQSATDAPSVSLPSTQSACDTMCSYAGRSATCSFRFQWGADHKYAGVADGCNKAREMVLAQCPSCTSCSLEASGCQLMASAMSPAPMPALVPALPRAASVEPISQSSCDALCTYLGRDASCAARIQYGATHRFSGQQDACKLAHASVTRQCPHCEGCTVASVDYMTHCVARQTASHKPYDCAAGLGNWLAGWSDAKKTWCCANEDTGCVPTTPTTTSIPFDCEAGYGNWALGWSNNKKEWCCSHEAQVQAVAQVRSALGMQATINKFAARGTMLWHSIGADSPSKATSLVWFLVGGLALFVTITASIRVRANVARSRQLLQAEEEESTGIPLGL